MGELGEGLVLWGKSLLRNTIGTRNVYQGCTTQITLRATKYFLLTKESHATAKWLPGIQPAKTFWKGTPVHLTSLVSICSWWWTERNMFSLLSYSVAHWWFRTTLFVSQYLQMMDIHEERHRNERVTPKVPENFMWPSPLSPQVYVVYPCSRVFLFLFCHWQRKRVFSGSNHGIITVWPSPQNSVHLIFLVFFMLASKGNFRKHEAWFWGFWKDFVMVSSRVKFTGKQHSVYKMGCEKALFK